MQANVSDYSTLGLSTHSVMNSNLRFSRHQNFTKIQFDSNFFHTTLLTHEPTNKPKEKHNVGANSKVQY